MDKQKKKLENVQMNQCSLYAKNQYCLWSPIYDKLQSQLREFEVRCDDVWIAGFPRSGTHWLSELTWLVCSGLDFDTALKIEQRNRVWYYDLPRPALFGEEVNEVDIKAHTDFFNQMQSPRFLKTHLPLELLPPKLLDTAKMVYIARDARDVIVSYYNYCKGFKPTSFKGQLKDFYEQFTQGRVPYTPYFSNVFEFWNHRQHPNMLFLFYEELSRDLPGAVRKVSKFFNQEYSDEQLDRLCSHLAFDSLKRNGAVNSTYDPKECEFVRKGLVGGWRTEFDEEMSQKAEKWIQEEVGNSQFTYKSNCFDT